MKKYRNRLQKTAVINLSFFLTIGYFSCMEVYMANYNEFAFPISYVWWTMLLAIIAVSVALSAVESLLPKEILLPVCALTLSAEVCFWVQSMFLNGKMETFYNEVVFTTGLKISNLLIWCFIAAVITTVIIIVSKKSCEKAMKYCMAIAGAMIVIQCAGFVTSAMSLPKSDKLSYGYLSSEGEFEISSDNNTVVFIIDTCDGKLVESTLEQYPDLFDEMEGFTYYPNMTTTYSRTYPSIIYLLTRERCYFDVPFDQYVENAYNDSTYLEKIKSTGADIRVFTEPSYMGTRAREYIDNYCGLFEGAIFEDISIRRLFTSMMRISGFKGAPYAAKHFFTYDTNMVNTAVINKYSEHNSEAYIAYEDAVFFKKLFENGLEISDSYCNAFRFYHLSGVHFGTQFDEKINPSYDASRETTLYADFRAIKFYLDEMKRLDIYDKATIFIFADHGNSFVTDNLEISDVATCLMIAKPSGVSQDETQKSMAHVCQEDFFPSVYEAFGLTQDINNGDAIWNIPETFERNRYYYHQALFSDGDGEVALREYLIDGDATVFSNWHLTGTYWDINYSQRGVSKHRLGELIE